MAGQEVRGIKTSLLGAEGLIMEVVGPGRLYVSTRSSEIVRVLSNVR